MAGVVSNLSHKLRQPFSDLDKLQSDQVEVSELVQTYLAQSRQALMIIKGEH